MKDDRLALWAHLVSDHSGVFPLNMTLVELIEIHGHEHDGPGTIRNHPRESRRASLLRIEKVLHGLKDDAFDVEDARAEHEPPNPRALLDAGKRRLRTGRRKSATRRR